MILLDMDGVLTNFVKGICELFEIDPAELYAKWAKGDYDICIVIQEMLGTNFVWEDLDPIIRSRTRSAFKPERLSHWKDEMWFLVDYHSFRDGSFWRDLQSYSWTRLLLKIINLVGEDWVICSTPSKSGTSHHGKVDWMNCHLANGKVFRDYVLTPRKDACASEFNILIDDNESNCANFEKMGGHTILFPQWWNRNHKHAGPGVLDWLVTQLSKVGVLENGGHEHGDIIEAIRDDRGNQESLDSTAPAEW